MGRCEVARLGLQPAVGADNAVEIGGPTGPGALGQHAARGSGAHRPGGVALVRAVPARPRGDDGQADLVGAACCF